MSDTASSIPRHQSLLAKIRNRVSDLSRRETPLTRPRDVIGWWEARRFAYNKVICITGLMTCSITGSIALISETYFHSEYGSVDSPLLAIFAIALYAILANVCYTLGWFAELLVRVCWPARADRFAARSFTVGLIFSIVLTLSPAMLLGGGSAYLLARHVLGGAHR